MLTILYNNIEFVDNKQLTANIVYSLQWNVN